MTAVKNDFAKLLSILNMVKRRITEFGNKGIETFQLEMQNRKKKIPKRYSCKHDCSNRKEEGVKENILDSNGQGFFPK